MHNTLARIQNVFGFFTSVASIVTVVIAFTSLIAAPVLGPELTEKTLTLNNVQV